MSRAVGGPQPGAGCGFIPRVRVPPGVSERDATVPAEAVVGGETTGIGTHELLVAAGAGLAGQAAMVPFFVAAYPLDATSPASFVGVAELIGTSAGAPLALPVGVALFVAGGTVTLPLLFVALAEFLPPERDVGLRGVSLAVVVWTGFAIAFSTGQTGRTLGVYAALSLGAHVAYGYALGPCTTGSRTRRGTTCSGGASLRCSPTAVAGYDGSRPSFGPSRSVESPVPPSAAVPPSGPPGPADPSGSPVPARLRAARRSARSSRSRSSSRSRRAVASASSMS